VSPPAELGVYPIKLRKTVSVQLSNGAIVKVDVTNTGREDIGSDTKQFQPVANAIEGGVRWLGHRFINEVEEGDGEVWTRTGDQSRQLMAVVMKGSGKANLEITLE